MMMVDVASGSLQAAYGQPTGGLTARVGVGWPGLRVSGRLAPFDIHHMSPVNSRSTLHDDSTINIILLLLIIIIIY